MTTQNGYYSPTTLIYIEVGEKKVRLSDVLCNTATLYESADIPPKTMASLVFSVDGIEERKDIILDEGISIDSEMISFSYQPIN